MIKKLAIFFTFLCISLNLVFAEEPEENEMTFEEAYELAQGGDAEAQYIVAKDYLYSIGVEENQEEGLKWLTKSANQGYAKAQNELGFQIRRMTLIEAADRIGDPSFKKEKEKRFEEAVKWYRAAAE